MGQFLVDLFMSIQGVTAVQLRPAAGSVVILFDPALCPQTTVLDALRSRIAPRVAEVLPAPSLPGEVEGRGQAFPFPYQDCTCAHAIAGRTRLVTPVARTCDDLAGLLVDFLQGQPGVHRVRLNAPAASIVVEHDPAIWNGAALQALVRAFNPDDSDLERFLASRPATDGEGQELTAASRREVALAGSALALSLLAGPAATPIAVGLLAVSSLSIFRKARHSLVEERRLTVDTLDATAIVLLAATGVVWQAALLNILLASGEWIRASTREHARRALSDVLDFVSDLAWVQRDGQIVSIPAREVTVGERVFVFPGDRIPVDGVVLAGKAMVDQRALTGESMPVEKGPDDPVLAATVVAEGELQVRALRVGQDTQAAQIVHMVENAPVFDTRAQDYAERWANRLVPFSFLGAGVMALLGNYTQAIAMLVIDYAAGFRVSAPTAVMSTITSAARQGILIRGGRHVEQLAAVDALVFDKTGTLTVGSPDVVGAVSLSPEHSLDELLALAASAESFLTHPVAEAVVRAASQRGLIVPPRSDFEYQIGHGVFAMVDGRAVRAGSRRYLEAQNIAFDQRAEEALRRIEGAAASPLCIGVDGRLAGVLGLTDPIRPEAAAVVQRLRGQGIKKIVMLTGDRAPVALAVARQLGIERVAAEALPADKLAAVQALQAQGYTVAVVGDGINDSPALAAADVGIAVNGGAALAQEAADVVILQGDLGKLAHALDIARHGVGLIRQNWTIIRLPNTIGLGLAFLGLLSPVGASLISDGAALAAGANSLRPLMRPGARP